MKISASSASNWFKWAPRKERLLAAELIAQSLEQVDISEGELRKAGLGTQLWSFSGQRENRWGGYLEDHPS